jgi:hypothetical protein
MRHHRQDIERHGDPLLAAYLPELFQCLLRQPLRPSVGALFESHRRQEIEHEGGGILFPHLEEEIRGLFEEGGSPLVLAPPELYEAGAAQRAGVPQLVSKFHEQPEAFLDQRFC